MALYLSLVAQAERKRPRDSQTLEERIKLRRKVFEGLVMGAYTPQQKGAILAHFSECGAEAAQYLDDDAAREWHAREVAGFQAVQLRALAQDMQAAAEDVERDGKLSPERRRALAEAKTAALGRCAAAVETFLWRS